MGFRGEIISAEFRVVTPMFLGDADQEATIIRGQSVKGALAFWWRAFQFSNFAKKSGSNLEKALSDLKFRERELFGGQDSGGCFSIKIDRADIRVISREKVLNENGKEKKRGENSIGIGARYLGYGVINTAGKLERSCIAPGGEFTLSLLFHPGKPTGELAKDVEEILTALRLFGALGGLGSRVRRGYGSVALTSISGTTLSIDDGPFLPQNKGEYEGYVKDLLEVKADLSHTGMIWPLTAFSKETRCLVTDKINNANSPPEWHSPERQLNPVVVLDYLGRAMLNYRGWGYNGGYVGGQKVQQQFKEDHDWYKKGICTPWVPYRTAFGLPHMYNAKQGHGIGAADEDSGRRASPILFHVHETPKDTFGVVTLLPTKFLAGEVSCHLGSGENRTDPYTLKASFAPRSASGLDVLQDFLGIGAKKFTPNQVLKFKGIL